MKRKKTPLQSPASLSVSFIAIIACLIVRSFIPAIHADEPIAPSSRHAVFDRDNLVAWCIVPFDSKKRTPSERAAMLQKIGIRKLAYDYRAEHISTFDEEMEQLKKHGIELTAWWFPSALNDEAQLILNVLERHQLKTQLWVTGGGEPTKSDSEQEQRIVAESERIRTIADAAAKIGCTVGLYNHGGWFGEIENQIAIIERLKLKNIGIVYNLHHGHADLPRFSELLGKMKPYLYALNLNGMVTDGDKVGSKILPLGTGTFDRSILDVIKTSGYTGLIGILNHTDHDAEARLLDNLDGLDWLLNEAPDKPFPSYRTWTGEKPTEETLTQWSAAEREAVQRLAKLTHTKGQPDRGVSVFASARTACIACHKVGRVGGAVGPELTNIGKDRSVEQLVGSLLYPNKHVDEKYRVFQILTVDQEIVRGYRASEDESTITLRDPSTGREQVIAMEAIEQEIFMPSLMPEGLAKGMTTEQQADLIAFLADLGHHKRLRLEIALSVLEHAQPHAAAEFPLTREPIDSAAWPHWQAHVNRNRVYDFYTKQANYFRPKTQFDHLLAPYPGLDTGVYGHWGNQDEQTWANDAWNRTELGSIQSGVFHGDEGLVVARGICVQLGENRELSVCFNPDTATYDAAWKDGFLKFSNVRHGFMHGLSPKGKTFRLEGMSNSTEPIVYQGLYRHKDRVIFAYKIGDVEYLDSPWVENGKFVRVQAPKRDHPMKAMLTGGELQWPQVVETKVAWGDDSPYAMDTIELPWENPWHSLMFVGDHDFLPDGSVLICTMQGDVWRGEGVSLHDAEKPQNTNPRIKWRRFASGLHHALGLKVNAQGIFVLGRDQITRLHDFNRDGEADFYECFSNAYQTSAAGHDFICGLQQDTEGNFFLASGNQGLVRVSADGRKADVVAVGFRNPDGLGIYPDGVITVPSSEGEWTPTSMISAVRPTAKLGGQLPFYGYRGGKWGGQPATAPELPLVYLPRGIDNSSGGQVYIDSDRWGPLKGQMIHLSFGAGSHFLLLRDEADGVMQGAVVPLKGEFLSGVHRGRFNPIDGQLYVSGMGGWGTYTTAFGCLQRVRYTGDRVQMPIGVRAHENGIAISFCTPLDPSVVTDAKRHFAQAWNYRYSAAYGSAEYSPSQYGMRGHDRWRIPAAHCLDDGKTLFLELPDLQPVNQLHVQVAVDEERSIDLFMTCHRFHEPRTDLPNYKPIAKTWSKHPMEIDIAMATRKASNPWRNAIADARPIEITAGKNLTYETTTFKVKRGEAIALTLNNPDVVPHNWALVKPGKLQAVGEEANKLVGDPEALIRQYAPQTDDVICYTDIADPGQSFTIYFRVPDAPGRYPYLCTFPGHWMVMNGEMIVE